MHFSGVASMYLHACWLTCAEVTHSALQMIINISILLPGCLYTAYLPAQQGLQGHNTNFQNPAGASRSIFPSI